MAHCLLTSEGEEVEDGGGRGRRGRAGNAATNGKVSKVELKRKRWRER